MLEQNIAGICRKVARILVTRKAKGEKFSKMTVNVKRVHEFLGVEKFRDRELDKKNKIGSVNGLAWTSTGGSVLQIDVAQMVGKNKFMLTGQLGDVMEESAKAAHTYLKANATILNIDERIFDQYDLHIHVPDGATPKDGPSAGITLYTTLASLYTQRKVKEKIAMTGEITLRGLVLPVGGIKEKILAAKRAGIKEVILSQRNKKDVDEIKSEYIEGITFHYLQHVDKLLPLVLEQKPIKHAKTWDLKKTSGKK